MVIYGELKKIFAQAVGAAQISDFQIAITHHRMVLESRKYHPSTQNQKLHRTVSLDFFRKKSTFQLSFHFTTLNKASEMFGQSSYENYIALTHFEVK